VCTGPHPAYECWDGRLCAAPVPERDTGKGSSLLLVFVVCWVPSRWPVPWDCDQEWETLADAALDLCRDICHYALVFARSAVGWWGGRDIKGRDLEL
jgi:hypothetical protein